MVVRPAKPAPQPDPTADPLPPKRRARAPGSISAQFLHAQLMFMQHHAEPKGVDARCLANLVWALAKLDLSSDDTALSTEIALNVAPFVLRSLGGSSPQVGEGGGMSRGGGRGVGGGEGVVRG